MAIKQFGNRSGSAIVVAEHREFQRCFERRRQIEIIPFLEVCRRQAEFMKPGTQIKGLSKADPGDPGLLVLSEPAPQALQVLNQNRQGLFRRRQDHVMNSPVNDLTGKVHQHGFHVRPVKTNTERIGAVGREFQDGRGLAPAAVVTFARFEDETFLDQVLDDGANGRICQLHSPGQIRLGGFAGAPQDLQNNALVVPTQLRGIRASSGCAGLHHLPRSSNRRPPRF